MAQKVMVSTSGSELLPQDAVAGLRTRLLPLATVVTPNIPEARLLLRNAGVEVDDPGDLQEMISLARQLHGLLGPRAVLLKGGHLPLTRTHIKADGGPSSQQEARLVVDVLFDGDSTTLFETDFVVSKNTHGTGCSLASAIAANLALGKDLTRAVRGAVRYVEAGIRTSVGLGRGNGPINHFHSLYALPFAPYVVCLCVAVGVGVLPAYMHQRSISGICPRPSTRAKPMEAVYRARFHCRAGQRPPARGEVQGVSHPRLPLPRECLFTGRLS